MHSGLSVGSTSSPGVAAGASVFSGSGVISGEAEGSCAASSCPSSGTAVGVAVGIVSGSLTCSETGASSFVSSGVPVGSVSLNATTAVFSCARAAMAMSAFVNNKAATSIKLIIFCFFMLFPPSVYLYKYENNGILHVII